MNGNSFYYSSDKRLFPNLFDALEYCKTNGTTPYFYYNDHVYQNVDWKTEPPESLEYYYREQAQRIRDEYDYVVLFYSGGYDSTNILETFHFNNIKLDKVVCVGAFKQDTFSNVDENHNGEIYLNCFPYIKELGLESITQLCDYTDYFGDIKNFSVYQYGEEWIENVGPWFSVHHWFWKDIHKYVVPEHMQGKKVALIWGKDKPCVSEINGRYSFRFSDRPALSYSGIGEVPNMDRINFYWDTNFTILTVKQAHVVKRLKTEKRFIDRNHAVYNLRKPIIFQSPKSSTPLLSLRDNFLLNHKNSSVFDFYSMGIKKLVNKVDYKHIPLIYSRNYYLE